MAHSTKLSDALHILAFVAMNPNNDLTSDAIATSLASNSSSVRQMMGKLKRAGLITSVTGHAKPALARPADEITMLDVYHAVEGEKPLLHLDTHTNPACGVGVNVQLVIGEYFTHIQVAAEQAMSQVTLEQIIQEYKKRTAMQWA
jgi:Rrf2 family protein